MQFPVGMSIQYNCLLTLWIIFDMDDTDTFGNGITFHFNSP